MTDKLILHHHDPSPFAEKIRLAFGIKDLAWSSVQVPMAMPKPDLVALTGGYRGTPVLQIGADVYCDTRLIIAEVERRYPATPLLRSGPLVNFGLQHWSDDTVFPPGAALAMHLGAAAMPEGLLQERSRYFVDLDFTRFSQDADYFRSQILAHAALIDRQLSDGRHYLLGAEPEWVDIGAFFPFWMIAHHVPEGRMLTDNKQHFKQWYARLASHGNGLRTEMSSQEALDIAKSTSLPPVAQGELVAVFPVPHPETVVTGMLTSVSDEMIIIRRSSPEIQDIAVHFPKIGYRVGPATDDVVSSR